MAKTSEIPDGEMLKVTIDGLDIVIINQDGKYYALDDTCTHAGSSLSEGKIKDGRTLVCGWHGAEFDCTTGKLSKFPAQIRDLTSYVVTTESDSIFVEM